MKAVSRIVIKGESGYLSHIILVCSRKLPVSFSWPFLFGFALGCLGHAGLGQHRARYELLVVLVAFLHVRFVEIVLRPAEYSCQSLQAVWGYADAPTYQDFGHCSGG